MVHGKLILVSIVDRPLADVKTIPRRVFIGGTLAAATAGSVGAVVTVGQHRKNIHEDFQFSRGTVFQNGEQERLRGFLISSVDYPRHKIQFIGHSGTEGDEDANIELSESRAQAALSIYDELQMDPARVIKTIGVGGALPLKRIPDISDRTYQSMLARVTVSLMYQL